MYDDEYLTCQHRKNQRFSKEQLAGIATFQGDLARPLTKRRPIL
jgi:hypothetical protein